MLIVLLFVALFTALTLSAYFSGTEAAYLALNQQRYLADLQKGDHRAVAIKPLLDDPSRALTILLFGNNLANIASIYVAVELWVLLVGVEEFAYFVPIASLCFLILVEIIPKSIFRRRANSIMYLIGRYLYAFEKLFLPFIVFIPRIGDLILTLLFLPFSFFSKEPLSAGNEKKSLPKSLSLSGLGKIDSNRRAASLPHHDNAAVKNGGDNEDRPFGDERLPANFSREDFSEILSLSESEGLFSSRQFGFMQKLATLSKTRVSKLMIPLADLPICNIDQDLESLKKAHQRTEVGYLPVYEKRIDNILGCVDLQDLFYALGNKKTVKDLLTRPVYIPDNATADRAFPYLLEHKAPVLITVNEYGGCSGLLSLNRIIEDMFDFHLREGKGEGKKNRQLFTKVAKKSFEVDTAISIDDLSKLLKLPITKDGFETVGGLVNSLFGFLPEEGAVVYMNKARITVLKSTRQSVEKVRIDVL